MEKMTDADTMALVGAVETRARFLESIIEGSGNKEERMAAVAELEELEMAAKKLGIWTF